MKKYLIGLFLIGIMGCNYEEDPNSKTVSEGKITYHIGGREFTVYEIDGCEYLGYDVGGSDGVLIHKGNCKNPIHYSH